MIQKQLVFPYEAGQSLPEKLDFGFIPDLVIVLGPTRFFKGNEIVSKWKELLPDSVFAGSSTAGVIAGSRVFDDSVVVSGLKFSATSVKFYSVNLKESEGSEASGRTLIKRFPSEGLRHVFILSDGLLVNGTELVNGILSELPSGVNVTGGLAGDGALFSETFVINEEGQCETGVISAIGFYSDVLKVGYGSMGGWDSFGIERIVTRSEKNVLFEIDNQPALKLYKSFLGEKADGLPGTGLLFPLSVRMKVDSEPVVRTILAIDEVTQSLTFAGDVPEGASVKLMKANVDRLIDGAEGAGNISVLDFENTDDVFAILVSCVGRKLVLKQMVEEEVEAVNQSLGERSLVTGFYSYGELAPFLKDTSCELHNQTMTVTAIKECVV